MVNNLVLRWPEPFFFMVCGGVLGVQVYLSGNHLQISVFKQGCFLYITFSQSIFSCVTIDCFYGRKTPNEIQEDHLKPN